MITKEELLKQKRISNVFFSFGFEPVHRIERHMYSLEKRLKKLFPDESVDTKVPYDFIPTAPRFLLRNTRKERFLEVSAVSALLKIKITDEYSKEIHKGLSFFKSHVRDVFDKIVQDIDPSFNLVAGIFRVEYSTKKLEGLNPRSLYFDKFLNTEKVPTPYDFTFKLVYIEGDKYFVNYNIDHFVTMRGKIPVDKKGLGEQKTRFIRISPKTMNGIEITNEGIRIDLDINNKYIVDGHSESVPDVDPSSSIEDIFKIAQSKIDTLEEFLL